MTVADLHRTAVERGIGRVDPLHDGADVVIAAGLAAQKHRLGTALFLAKSERTAPAELIALIQTHALKFAAQRGFEVPGKAWRGLIEQVLDVWLDPGCRHCAGTGTGHREGQPCDVCAGAGHRRGLIGRDRPTRAFAAELLADIERQVDRAAALMRRRLHH